MKSPKRTEKTAAPERDPRTSPATTLQASKRQWGETRIEKADERAEHVQMVVNATHLCEDKDMYDLIRRRVLDHQCELARQRSSGERDMSPEAILERKREAGRQKKFMSVKKIAALIKAREASPNFRNGKAESYGFDVDDILSSNVQPTVSVPRTPKGRVALADRLCADPAMLRVLCRAVQAKRLVENETLTPEQLAERDRLARENRRKYTVTDAVRAHHRTLGALAHQNSSKFYTFDGVKRNIREWAIERGLSYTAMKNRLAKYPPKVALAPNFNELVGYPVPKNARRNAAPSPATE